MSKKTKKEEENVTRLANVRPWFVSLVDFGANHGGKDHHFALKSADLTEKRVPDKDASDEDKQAALNERSESYGIEIMDDAALSYPADFPTKESLYSDPVNLKYPIGDASNNIDLGRIRNALARFKQNYEEYKEETSRARVYERIVRAALDNDVEVSFDPEDPVDKLLPSDIKDELQKVNTEKEAEETKKHLASLALRAKLADLTTRLTEKSDPASSIATPQSIDEVSALHATVKTANETIEALKKENASLVGKVKDLDNKLTTAVAKASRLNKRVASATQLSGMHLNGDELSNKRIAGPTFPARYTGGN